MPCADLREVGDAAETFARDLREDAEACAKFWVADDTLPTSFGGNSN
ncbi:MAG TPA: hypothetical protein VGB76_06115 [Pyrinomonadaceae bacterium]